MSRFLVSCADLPEVLVVVEGALDQVVLTIDCEIDRKLHSSIALCRDVAAAAANGDQIDDSEGVIESTDHKIALGCKAPLHRRLLRRLPRRKFNRQKRPAMVYRGVDLGAQSAAMT